jgi:predicted transcriptional regulator
MGRKRQDVTSAELAILQVLWDHGPLPIREITLHVYEADGPSEYATVKKLLARLEAKGCVSRNRRATAHVYSANMGQDELIGQRLQTLADNLCGGSRTPLLMHLLRTEALSAQERKELRQFLADLMKTQSQRNRRDADSS